MRRVINAELQTINDQIEHRKYVPAVIERAEEASRN
jgi:hypothetical protein